MLNNLATRTITMAKHQNKHHFKIANFYAAYIDKLNRSLLSIVNRMEI